MWCIFYCTLWLLICSVQTYVADQKFIEVHELNSKELLPADQLAPIDPALHAFPTVPTVPLLPNCIKEGYLRDPFNCGKFYRCEYNQGVPITYYCQLGLIFNTLTNSCDHPQNVQC